MESDSFKRILIIGQPFNNSFGGGITLTSLFKEWPKDKIAVASIGHSMFKVSTEVCDNYYQLGKEEQSWIFPFNILQKSFPSGLLSFNSQEPHGQTSASINIRKTLVESLFFPLLHWFGLFHCLSKITFSQHFLKWLSVYKPEILYLQVTTREEILYSIQLCDYLNIPTAIHIMDDWPSTISKKGLLKNYWRKKIDKEFRQLLDRVDLFFSISEAMSSEYLKRYNREFKAFHHSIDISRYNQINSKAQKSDNSFKILYIGRIGVANKHSIYLFSKTISQFKSDHYDVHLYIFTNDINTRESKPIEKLENVKIFPAVNHNAVPELLPQYDLLLLPLDFTEMGLKYARYSIPTKASEYLASGTPVLVFAPKEMAISKFCTNNDCGFCVTDQSPEKIKDAIKFLINNEDYRLKLSNNAVNLAKELFDENKVRRKFQQLLITNSKMQNHV
jgi:glycosyltransferase involved in cell wall biosynthesis